MELTDTILLPGGRDLLAGSRWHKLRLSRLVLCWAEGGPTPVEALPADVILEPR